MKKELDSSWERDGEEEIYSPDFREELMDDDEIDSWESAFMSGYEEAG